MIALGHLTLAARAQDVALDAAAVFLQCAFQ
jgi:hypothetical protein